jgi:hypothetical protein
MNQSTLRSRPPGDNPTVGDFIADRLHDVNKDMPPSNDSLQAFDFEGAGSVGGSLSSVGSGSTSSSADQDFGFLNSWGPPFRKLADLYGSDGGEDDDDVHNIANV